MTTWEKFKKLFKRVTNRKKAVDELRKKSAMVAPVTVVIEEVIRWI